MPLHLLQVLEGNLVLHMKEGQEMMIDSWQLLLLQLN